LHKLVPFVGLQVLATTLVFLNAISPPFGSTNVLFYDPSWFYALLNAFFLLPAGLALAYITSKGFQKSGLVGFQLMGCGAVALCLSSMATFAGNSGNSITFYYTMYIVLGLALGTLFHSTGVGLVLRGTTVPQSARIRVIAVTYATFVLLGLFLAVAAPDGWKGVFLNSSFYYTSLGEAIILAAGVLYASLAIILLRMYLNSKSEVVYWYAVAMLLVALSVGINFYVRREGDMIDWLFRGTTFLYGWTFFIAVLKGTQQGTDQTR
jgi:hypothetical protein